MEFELSEEQRLLAASLRRLLADRYGFEQRKTYARTPEGWSRAVWHDFGDLGLLALPFAEEDGGLGGGPVETMVVAEALGEALTLEPWFATVVLGGGFLRHGGSSDLRRALVPGIASGNVLLAVAHAEPAATADPGDVATVARREGSRWRLDGCKTLVLHGDVADHIVVTARVFGAGSGPDGLAAFLVPATATGLTRRALRTNDGRRAAEIVLDDVAVADDCVLGEPGEAFPLIERVVQEAIAALAAEAVGVMTLAHRLTVDYLKTRRQFGRPIGSFQVLQHRATDMLIAIEEARSMAIYAAMSLDEPDAAERRRALAAVKALIGRRGRFVAETAVQLHGGIGLTMDYAVGHCMARLLAIDALFGNAAHHLARLADDGGLIRVA
ncbi:MAG: acyl-CoA dehydrogenase family protein [Elioraea sp.]|nr:acyl-CoA dehydrogenase family protein [Elioraea sp.]